MGWLQCRLSFSLLRLLIMHIIGAHSSIHHFNKQLAASVDLAVEEARLFLLTLIHLLMDFFGICPVSHKYLGIYTIIHDLSLGTN